MKEALTVLIPVKDEEQNIRLCIESAWEIADEILVADSGSSDRTMDIAAQYKKVRIIERDYRTSGDFKNWAIPQSSHKWVLVIDADERVTKALGKEISEILTHGPHADGFWIYRNNHFMGHRLKFGDARTDKVLRLFQRDKSYYAGPSDHGEVVVTTGRISKLKNRFEHYTVWDYDQLFKKFHRYTKLQAEQWHDKGRDATYFSLLVRPLFRFFREYILQGGILDGKKGLQLAWMAAFYSFTKQARLWAINHGVEQPDPESEMATTIPINKDIVERRQKMLKNAA
jgi:glycosyltransferase involved in cell wall biosynthesis